MTPYYADGQVQDLTTATAVRLTRDIAGGVMVTDPPYASRATSGRA